MHPMYKLLWSADLLAVSGEGSFSPFIRFFTRRRGEAPTKATHIMVCTLGGFSSEAQIVEAQAKVIERPLIPAYFGPRAGAVGIARLRGISSQDAATVVKAARSWVGRRYGAAKLLTHAGDWCLSRLRWLFTRRSKDVYLFRRLTPGGRYPVCDWIASFAFIRIGRGFGVPPEETSPDTIWDYIEAHPEEWEIVRPFASLTLTGLPGITIG